MKSHNTKTISQSLVKWYHENGRELPWRKTTDPYKIWVSEIVLQQTTVRQGLDYFNRFIKAFPSVQHLASASEDQVLKLWQGLGYYSRARNLLHAAQYICNELGGQFPTSYKDLLSLKGVGPYTAAAIASFAYNLSHVVVDGNVIRFISRQWGIQDAVDTTPVKKSIESIGSKLISHQEPSVFNQAIMEIGALCCTYKNPNCKNCPVQSSCIAYKKNIVHTIPYKSKKIKKKKRFFYYFHIVDKSNNTIIHKRTSNDIWKGMYQFPIQEVDGFETSPSIDRFVSDKSKYKLYKSKIFRQTLTHQYIHALFIKLIIDDEKTITKENEEFSVKAKDISKYAWPKIIDLYFKDLSITLF